MAEIDGKIAFATKWSALTEVLSKLVTPISSMILARLLTPSAFGIIATLNMIIAFAEVFTDAGFQRYVIQRQFSSDTERNQITDVAFWSNLVMSLFLWILIAIFRDPLAALVGNPTLGGPLAIACVAIPLTAFSSLQFSLFKKDFDFKTLFWVRLVGIAIPLLVTVPLAFYLRSFWALLIGNIAKCVADATILSVKSKWKPSLYFSFAQFKEMISFCLWTIFDAILIWMTGYVDVFFVGRVLSDYYLGLYKTSISTVGQITSLITAIIVPVLEPTYASLQNNYPELRKTLYKLQKYLGILLIPMGVGIYMYSDLITIILLGDQWMEASEFIGLWALLEVITIMICRFISNIFPAIGKPKVAVICQMLYLAALIPGVVISVQHGFQALYYTRAFMKLEFCVVYLIAAYLIVKVSPQKMLKNLTIELLASVAMGLLAFGLLLISRSIWWQLVTIPICAVFYFVCLSFIPSERVVLSNLKERIISRVKK